MVRSLDPASEKFLTDLDRVVRRAEKAQRQLSSGLRMSVASDDPDQVSSLLESRADLSRMERLQLDLGRIQTEVDTAEQSLQSAVRLMERAAVLGQQGVNGTQTAATRAMIAGEVESVLEQLVGASRAQVDGRYIFSGDSDREPPYTFNPASIPPMGFYSGAAATRQFEHPNGYRFPIARSADGIFDNADPDRNAFAAVANLRAGLLSNDQAAIEAALGQVRTAADHLNGELAWYGSAQNKVAEAAETARQQELLLRTQIATIEEADVTEGIIELTQARYHQEVALATRSKMRQTTLFDFIA